MEQYYILAPSNNDLYHHGILGQKWGKQNGPPYPLGSSSHSAAEKRAGWRKSLNGGSSRAEKKQAKKEAKAEKYRTGETNRLKVEREKLENKLAKTRNPKSNSSLRKQERLNQISKEIEVVSNMSMEDISKEKKKEAVRAFTNALAMGGVAAATIAMGNPMTIIIFPNYKGMKTQSRLGKEQLKQIRKDTWDLKDSPNAQKVSSNWDKTMEGILNSNLSKEQKDYWLRVAAEAELDDYLKNK